MRLLPPVARGLRSAARRSRARDDNASTAAEVWSKTTGLQPPCGTGWLRGRLHGMTVVRSGSAISCFVSMNFLRCSHAHTHLYSLSRKEAAEGWRCQACPVHNPKSKTLGDPSHQVGPEAAWPRCRPMQTVTRDRAPDGLHASSHHQHCHSIQDQQHCLARHDHIHARVSSQLNSGRSIRSEEPKQVPSEPFGILFGAQRQVEQSLSEYSSVFEDKSS